MNVDECHIDGCKGERLLFEHFCIDHVPQAEESPPSSTTSNTKQELREKIRNNDRIYQNLMHIHRTEHIDSDCFCTTEVSGAYRNIIDETTQLLADTVNKVLDELVEKRGQTVDHTLGKPITIDFVSLSAIEQVRKRFDDE